MFFIYGTVISPLHPRFFNSFIKSQHFKMPAVHTYPKILDGVVTFAILINLMVGIVSLIVNYSDVDEFDSVESWAICVIIFR